MVANEDTNLHQINGTSLCRTTMINGVTHHCEDPEQIRMDVDMANDLRRVRHSYWCSKQIQGSNKVCIPSRVPLECAFESKPSIWNENPFNNAAAMIMWWLKSPHGNKSPLKDHISFTKNPARPTHAFGARIVTSKHIYLIKWSYHKVNIKLPSHIVVCFFNIIVMHKQHTLWVHLLSFIQGYRTISV